MVEIAFFITGNSIVSDGHFRDDRASLMLFCTVGHTRIQPARMREGGTQMRQSNKEAFAQEANRRLFSVDFHDFLEKESTLNDVEMSREFHISIRDVQELRRKLRR